MHCLLQEQCGSYTFIPYVVSPQGKVFACDATMMTGIKELIQPSFQLEPLLTPLVEQLVHLLNNVHVQSRSVMYWRALLIFMRFPKTLSSQITHAFAYAVTYRFLSV